MAVQSLLGVRHKAPLLSYTPSTSAHDECSRRTASMVCSKYMPNKQNDCTMVERRFRYPVPFSVSCKAASTKGTSSEASIASAKKDVLKALSQIIDPDFGTDIVSCGFVKDMQLDEISGEVSFRLELTTPACPIKDMFEQQANAVVAALPWVQKVNVTMSAQPAKPVFMEEMPTGLKAVSNIIAVSSCKGGVGKSTVAVNLAYTLVGMGARVGIFDADVYGPSLPTMVSPENRLLQMIPETKSIIPTEYLGVKLVSFGFAGQGRAIMRGPMVSGVINQLLTTTEWGELDYLVIDMPPGTGDIQLTLCQVVPLTAAVIVTTPQKLAFIDVAKGVRMFSKLKHSVRSSCSGESLRFVSFVQTSTTVALLNSSPLFSHSKDVPNEGNDFSSAQLEWTPIGHHNAVMDLCAAIPLERLSHFVKGEGLLDGTETTFIRKEHHEKNLTNPTNHATKMYSRYHCAFGPHDNKRKPQTDMQRLPRFAKKRGCKTHFRVRVMYGRLDIAIITYNEFSHQDASGEFCHGKDDPSGDPRSMVAPRLSNEYKSYIESLLLMGVGLSTICEQHYLDPSLTKLMNKRDTFLLRKDVLNAWKRVRSLRSQKNENDAKSVSLWNMEEKDNFFYYKTPNSGENIPFIIGIQTPWMREMMVRYSHNSIIAMDSTFSTNKYAVPCVAVVENMCHFEADGKRYYPFGKGSGSQVVQQFGIPYLFELPIRPTLSASGDGGNPEVVNEPQGDIAKIFSDIGVCVVQQCAKLRQQVSTAVAYDKTIHAIRVKVPGSDEEFFLHPATVRRNDRSAQSVDEWTGEQKLQYSDVPEDIEPESIRPMGNYAVSLTWPDGFSQVAPYDQLQGIERLVDVPNPVIQKNMKNDVANGTSKNQTQVELSRDNSKTAAEAILEHASALKEVK